MGPEFPTDQRYDDAGSLVFNTFPLEDPIAIVGTTTLELHVRSDSQHAQLAVRLNDVANDGASTRITYGSQFKRSFKAIVGKNLVFWSLGRTRIILNHFSVFHCKVRL